MFICLAWHHNSCLKGPQSHTLSIAPLIAKVLFSQGENFHGRPRVMKVLAGETGNNRSFIFS